MLAWLHAQPWYQDYVAANTGEAILVLAQVFNAVMIATCKLLETDPNAVQTFNPFQILFARMFITYVCCLVYMGVTKCVPEYPFGPANLRKLLLARGFFGFFGVFGLYYSLQYLSISDAVAITFLVPMVTGLLAWVLIHERYLWTEAGCALVSFFGVVLIAKPAFIFGASEDEAGDASGNPEDDSVELLSSSLRLLATGVGLLGVMGALSVYVILRKIGMQAHPLLSVLYFSLMTCVVLCIAIVVVPAYSFRLPELGYQWFLFMLIGFLGFIMQFCLALGVQRVRAGRALMMSYSNMVFALILDVVLWHHLPGLLLMLGISLIIGMAVVVLRHKAADAVVDDPEAKDIPLNVFTDDEVDTTL